MSKKDDAFQKAQEALNEAKKTSTTLDEADKESIASSISQNFSETLEPMLLEMITKIEQSGKDTVDAIKKIDVSSHPTITLPSLPEIKIPPITVPQPKVTVNIPKADTPVVHVSPTPITFPDSMALRGIDNSHPLPVILTDDKGNPYIAGSFGGGGGRGPVNIADIMVKGATILDQSNTALRVNVVAGGAGGGIATVQDGYGSLITSHVFGDFKGLDVNLIGATGSLAAALIDSSGVAYSGSNPFPVSGSFSASLSAAIGQGDSASALRIIQGGDSVSSVIVNGILTSLSTNIVDSSGIAYSGSNPLPITGNITTVTGITNSLQVSIIDSSGVEYAGSNPIPIRQASSDFNQNQISCSTSTTLIAASNPNRTRILITNTGTTDVFIGGAAVTISTGHLIKGIAGYPIALRTTQAIYGIVSASTQTVTFLEEIT